MTMITAESTNSVITRYIANELITCTLDYQGIICDTNQKFRELVGLATYDIIGRKYSGFLANEEEIEDLEKLLINADDAIISKNAFLLDSKVCGYKECKISIYPVFTNSGSKNYVLIHKDVTQLRQIQSLHHTLFDDHPDSLLVCDIHGRILLCNESASKTFACPCDELRCMNIVDLIDPFGEKSQKDIMTSLRKTLLNHSKQRVSATGSIRNGTQFPIEVSFHTYHKNILVVIKKLVG